MKLLLLLAVVQAWAGFADLRRKGLYQHHRDGRRVNLRRSSPNTESIDQFTGAIIEQNSQHARSHQLPMRVYDNTDDKNLIEQLLGSFEIRCSLFGLVI